MSDIQDSYNVSDRIETLSSELGIHIPDIYLPSDLSYFPNWPVIACDQYTSSPDYWNKVRHRVEAAGNPSAYEIILPEIFLEEPGDIPLDKRISGINIMMREYLDSSILTSRGRCMVFADRKTPHAQSRKGIVLAVDLDKYDFHDGSKALIRATEGTVLERIPPRLEIRKDAALEIPHVMLLMDDPEDTVIGPLSAKFQTAGNTPIYDIELPEGGGHITAHMISHNSRDALDVLMAISQLRSLKEEGLLFAVGDGNHSLATAKTHWENIRSSCAPDHPARYALVEIVNIYDRGLTFEPIHRVLFGASPEEFAAFVKSRLPVEFGVEISDGMSLDNAMLMSSTIDPAVQPFTVFGKEHAMVMTCSCPPSAFTAGTAQHMIDSYIAAHPAARVDYIHGEDEVRILSAKGTGILLPPLHKEDFFGIIAERGSLPRKTFSMGEADEKRFYMECRRII